MNVVASGKSDAERAAEYKTAMRAKLEDVCRLIEAAGRDDIIISFNIGRDGFGRSVVMALDAVKRL